MSHFWVINGYPFRARQSDDRLVIVASGRGYFCGEGGIKKIFLKLKSRIEFQMGEILFFLQTKVLLILIRCFIKHKYD